MTLLRYSLLTNLTNARSAIVIALILQGANCLVDLDQVRLSKVGREPRELKLQ